MPTTHLTRHLDAPPAAVYRALTEAHAVQAWMVPDGMTSEVHEFEGEVGGRFRISLTYEEPGNSGKTSASTDTYHGRFVELVAGERVVQVMEFETTDPTMQGEMQLTFYLRPLPDGGCELDALHEGVPEGVSAADNELGWNLSLAKLKALVESRPGA
jgi:uncharacterized protein YndB with AHSA1/START domain